MNRIFFNLGTNFVIINSYVIITYYVCNLKKMLVNFLSLVKLVKIVNT